MFLNISTALTPRTHVHIHVHVWTGARDKNLLNGKKQGFVYSPRKI